ncbi:uncharacterized protein LOC129941190 [Eupeodes corollae]|uniref:uncharacterized protein LOC129941190 n=1 Tax=Eupeodes corollae TaxID=290404 RepID=UPI002491D579|nr:uncharacterized protein LOC129941190 [Eupeodes corollae]
MFVKFFGGLVLLGFFYIQLANSLECYSCDSMQGCKSPGKITCNSNNSNQTNRYLTQHFNQNLTNVTSSNFKCVFLNYTTRQSSYSNITYKGCAFDRTPVCELYPRNPALQKQKCIQCSAKLCNPAGTFSSSSLTVIASIIVVTLYKALNL